MYVLILLLVHKFKIQYRIECVKINYQLALLKQPPQLLYVLKHLYFVIRFKTQPSASEILNLKDAIGNKDNAIKIYVKFNSMLIFP